MYSSFKQKLKNLFSNKVFLCGLVFGAASAVTLVTLVGYLYATVPMSVVRQNSLGQIEENTHYIPRYSIGGFVRSHRSMGQTQLIRECAYSSTDNSFYTERRVDAGLCKVVYRPPAA